MNWLTHLGDTSVAITLAIVGFLEAAVRRVRWSKQAGERKGPLLLPWLGVGVAGAVTGCLKELFGRPRPLEVYPGLAVIPVDAGYAFPSGHATLAFALAGALAARWPKGRLLWLGLAVGVALSRIALGMHWPSDVIAGAGIGWGVVVGLIWLEKKLWKEE